MSDMIKYRIRWTACGKEYSAEYPAASASIARRAFEAYMLPGARIISVEPVEPDSGGERVPSHSPNSPFDPLLARRQLGIDDDVR